MYLIILMIQLQEQNKRIKMKYLLLKLITIKYIYKKIVEFIKNKSNKLLYLSIDNIKNTFQYYISI